MTKPATLEPDGPGRWSLGGDLDFNTVTAAWALLQALLRREQQVTLALDGVEHTNSAGLAFLLEGLEYARRRGSVLSFTSVPDTLLELAEISNIDQLIAQSIDSP